MAQKSFFILYIFCLLFFVSTSQNPVQIIDSLKIQLNKATKDIDRAKIIADLTWYYSMVNTDSAYVYGKKSIYSAKKIGDSTLIAQALSDFAVVNYSKGDLKTALDYYKKSLLIREKQRDSIGIASLHYKMGTAYHKKTQLDSAMIYYLKALKFYEDTGNEVLANSAESNIGALHFNQKNYNEALRFFNKNIIFFRKTDQSKLLGNALVNKASIQLVMKDTLEAVKTLKESIKISEAINNVETLGASYNNLGEVFMAQNKIEQAKDALSKSIQYRSNSNMDADLTSSKLTLAGIHNTLGEYKKARLLLDEIRPFYKREGIKEKLSTLYLQYITVFASEKRPDSARYYSAKYAELQEEIVGEKALNITNELGAKYESEKKQNEILKQRAQLAEKDLEVRRKNTFIFGSLGFAMLLGLLGYLLYNQQKLKNRQLQKEGELKTALAQIETQNKLQEQRLRISRDLHDNIGAQLTFIISSIDNLKYGFTDISEKLGDKLTSISNFTSQTIYELRDTIWAMNKENITFEDLQARIANFIEQAKNASERTEFSFTIDETVNETHVFSSVEGMNIYRIIQEAVNNALKYASADEIEVNILKEEGEYFIEIADNGVGFDQASIEMGNGLNNMKKRAREIGGKLQIKSSNHGTRILLRVPK
ncbi:tetratricopeptide repeat-containing sensor histidine kinase [Aequorivita lipolytica]|uniref:Tetratricopeptide repeat protein n=1 Tax=Aequorivita lipolytica TaxID=153267 RepID=A0A5C6YV46_9FLAO|nr:tetratricopeptide repeat protein [Aequorivita lipolytica]TXD70833.1 tetratricopeptide repeat protein [Aequorivita lipolytica]SRX49882.1 Sensor histidine kinase LiaS [Aequorivita lipolytica]